MTLCFGVEAALNENPSGEMKSLIAPLTHDDGFSFILIEQS